MRISKILIPILVLAITASCNSLFNNNDNRLELTLKATQPTSQITTFNGDSLVFDPQFYSDREPNNDLPAFTSQVKNKQIIVNGYYLCPNGTYQPAGKIDREGNKLTITIQQPENLPKTIHHSAVGWLYDATIQGLQSGTYSLVIVHKSDLMRGEIYEQHTVFSTEFEIE